MVGHGFGKLENNEAGQPSAMLLRPKFTANLSLLKSAQLMAHYLLPGFVAGVEARSGGN